MLLAVDPSINDIGITYLDAAGGYLESAHLRPPVAERDTPSRKLEALCRLFLEHLRPRAADIRAALIEHTRFFAREVRQSHPSAQKLNLAKGMLFGATRAVLSCEVHLVWMPGFSKDQANLLARAQNLPVGLSQHERDAFFMGFTWLKTPAQMRGRLFTRDEM